MSRISPDDLSRVTEFGGQASGESVDHLSRTEAVEKREATARKRDDRSNQGQAYNPEEPARAGVAALFERVHFKAKLVVLHDSLPRGLGLEDLSGDADWVTAG